MGALARARRDGSDGSLRLSAVLDGPEIIARSISATAIRDQYGNTWQYHSRSDRHSKIACWVIAFELMEQCALLREHVEQGKVVLGVNHTLHDFQTQRRKNLDLVIAQPRETEVAGDRSFAELGEDFGVVLTPEERARLERLPSPAVGEVGSVLVALEAKACMTAHVKALPRLHDELNSSHTTTHGNSERALAVGFVMVNAAPTFLSSDQNKRPLSGSTPVVNRHNQPNDTLRVIEKISEIRRRSGASGQGFDAIGIMVCELTNDGTPMRVVPSPDDRFPYGDMVRRIAHEYSAAFSRL